MRKTIAKMTKRTDVLLLVEDDVTKREGKLYLNHTGAIDFHPMPPCVYMGKFYQCYTQWEPEVGRLLTELDWECVYIELPEEMDIGKLIGEYGYEGSAIDPVNRKLIPVDPEMDSRLKRSGERMLDSIMRWNDPHPMAVAMHSPAVNKAWEKFQSLLNDSDPVKHLSQGFAWEDIAQACAIPIREPLTERQKAFASSSRAAVIKELVGEVPTKEQIESCKYEGEEEDRRLAGMRENGFHSTMNERESRRLVVVCEACSTAICWHGEMMCDDSITADIKEMTVGELNDLNLEHPDNYSETKCFKVTQQIPKYREPSIRQTEKEMLDQLADEHARINMLQGTFTLDDPLSETPPDQADISKMFNETVKKHVLKAETPKEPELDSPVSILNTKNCDCIGCDNDAVFALKYWIHFDPTLKYETFAAVIVCENCSTDALRKKLTDDPEMRGEIENEVEAIKLMLPNWNHTYTEWACMHECQVTLPQLQVRF